MPWYNKVINPFARCANSLGYNVFTYCSSDNEPDLSRLRKIINATNANDKIPRYGKQYQNICGKSYYRLTTAPTTYLNYNYLTAMCRHIHH